MLPESYRALETSLAGFIPRQRLITDPLRLLTWGTDASFYRLVPAIAVVVDSEDEVRRLLAACAQVATPVTFRAAGTSLSGQAITDSVLMLLGDGWRGCTIGVDAATVALQPGAIYHYTRLELGALRANGMRSPIGVDLNHFAFEP